MNSNESLNKWERMLTIVSQYPELIQPNLPRRFKNLFLRRLLAETIFVFLLQYIGLKITTLAMPSLVWFASGTACGFIFMRGITVLPGIWLGSFLAYFLLKINIWIACGCASVFTLQAWLLQLFCYQYISPTLIFNRTKPFLQFLSFSVVLSAIVCILLELICYSVLPKGIDPLRLWINWWLANLNGILIFSCALMTLDNYFPQVNSLKPFKNIAFIFSYGLLIAGIVALTLSQSPQWIVCFILLTLFFVIIISIKFGWCGAMSSVFLIAIIPSLANHFSVQTLIFLQTCLVLETILGSLVAILFGSRS